MRSRLLQRIPGEISEEAIWAFFGTLVQSRDFLRLFVVFWELWVFFAGVAYWIVGCQDIAESRQVRGGANGTACSWCVGCVPEGFGTVGQQRECIDGRVGRSVNSDSSGRGQPV